MPRKPSTSDYARAHAAKERALAGLRLMQLREKREWRRVVDAGMGAALAVIRDRLLAIPSRMSALTEEQRAALRQELADVLEAWSHARHPTLSFSAKPAPPGRACAVFCDRRRR
jgi:hypothetical protein